MDDKRTLKGEINESYLKEKLRLKGESEGYGRMSGNGCMNNIKM